MGAESIARLLSYATTILLARALLVEDFGVYSLFLSILGTLVASSAFGIPQAIIYYLGKQKATRAVLLQHLYLFWVIFSMSLVSILVLYQTFTTNPIFENKILYLLIGLFSLKLLDYYLISFLRGVQNFYIFNLKKIVEPILFILLICTMILWTEPGIFIIIGLYFIASWISTIALLVFIHSHYLKENFNFVPSKELMKGLTHFGLKSYAQNLSGHLNYQISIYMIAWMLTEVDVGYYAVAVSFASVLWFFPNALGMVLLPALSSKQDENEVNQMTTMVMRHTFYIVLGGIIVMAVLGQTFIPLFYGKAYMPSYIPMMILLPGILAMSLYKVLTRYFTSRNLHHLTVYVGIVALIVNIGGNFILIKIWGIEGGALASTLVFIFSALTLLMFFLKQSSVCLSDVFWIRAKDLQIYSELAKQVLHKNN